MPHQPDDVVAGLRPRHLVETCGRGFRRGPETRAEQVEWSFYITCLVAFPLLFFQRGGFSNAFSVESSCGYLRLNVESR